jgi:hypothetical protein
MADEPLWLQAERARAAAVVARDLQALTSLLDPGLRYVHATGLCHDRDGYLEYLRSGPRFLEVVLTPEQVVDLTEGAAFAGRLFMRLQRGGEAVIEARSWVSGLWLHTEAGWRLRLFQSTREAA